MIILLLSFFSFSSFTINCFFVLFHTYLLYFCCRGIIIIKIKKYTLLKYRYCFLILLLCYNLISTNELSKERERKQNQFNIQ
jgi:hypothetical protein